jgi:hypothetical protein
VKLSPYFSELSSSYGYEIEDLTYDSAGDNVLKSRLKVKRDQFGELLAMGDSFPVMVIPALRGAFKFVERAPLDRLVGCEPASFPTWASVKAAIEIEPWAEKLVALALASPGGEQFMLIAAGVEFIFSGLATGASAPTEDSQSESQAREPGEEGDEDEGSGDDLAEAGEDYLSEQGFDRRS